MLKNEIIREIVKVLNMKEGSKECWEYTKELKKMTKKQLKNELDARFCLATGYYYFDEE